jgi:hypothetical protein
VLPIIALAWLAQVPGGAPADTCDAARHHYEGLALEDALLTAERGLAEAPGAPRCLEIQALVLLALGRTEAARAALATLFEVAPEHAVEDPSLAPSTRALIEAVRAEVRPLSAVVAARWVVATALRVDVALEGGLRGAKRVRFRGEVTPGPHALSGEVPLVGSAGTATVAVPAGVEAQTLTLRGEALDAVGRVVLPFSSQLLLPPRPAPDVVVVAPPPAEAEGGIPWWVWVVVGAAVVAGAGTAVVVAQPRLPSADGTLGRVEL